MNGQIASAMSFRDGVLYSLLALSLVGLALVPQTSVAAGGGDWHMDRDPDLENLPSLQNGFRMYVNYCVGCHSLQYQRYERTADDLGIPHDVALDRLVFSGQKIGELITTAMDPEAAKNWFGAPPPDLTMVTRVRSPEWLYNYLKTFYVDDSRPFGVNNEVFENVGMPNVLMELQGIQHKGCIQAPQLAANGGEVRDPLMPGKKLMAEKCNQLYIEEGTGSMTPAEFDSAVYDLTNFMYYVGEPSRLERQRLGIYVLLFLVILGVFTYLLNREFWKDVH